MKGRFARVPLHAACASILDVRARVLIAICGHIGRGGWAYPSLTTIASLTGVQREHVARAVKELEAAGILHREPGGGRGNPTRYHVFDGGLETVPPMGPFFSETVPSAGTFNAGNVAKTPPETLPQMATRTEEQKELSERAHARARVCEWFMRFRSAYPSRGNCGDPETPARREFEAALTRGVDPEAIIAGAIRRADEVAREGTQPRFVKMSVNWLKDEGWLDRPRPVERRRPVAGMA